MRSAIKEILETILLTLLIFLAVRMVVQNFRVEGSSMEPSLHSGQYLLVNKAVYFNVETDEVNRLLPFLKLPSGEAVFPLGSPQRGDVVVFRFPENPSRDFIKRIIAVPGDAVEVRGGNVYVNGSRLDEPYIYERPNYPVPPTKVPPESFWVLGDNRNNSHDSHVWGMVPREYLIGKAWVVYWPMNNWGLAPNYSTNSANAQQPAGR